MRQLRRVVPAILADNAADLEHMVRQAERFALWAQFDIMDGLFVPSQSIFSAEIAATSPSFQYDIHLMVHHPESYFPSFRLAGTRRITFHDEATPYAESWLPYIKDFGLEVGLALNPETPAEVITAELAAKVDALLLLSVDPGYYGRPFIPDVLEKAKELRQVYPELTIGLDGGIKAENITEIARAGVDEICVGSAIFGSSDPAEAYRQLVVLAELGWQEYDEKG
ncbi:MAG: ribulose-phosphate 3-epimerase [Dehalococcoidia bacterium]|nr:ribulose-phosphate 3-epimerase [Dehalococcoidia bacterium]